MFLSLYWIVTVKDVIHVKINNVNLLYLIIDKINGYIEQEKGSKYLMLFPTDQSKETLKRYE